MKKAFASTSQRCWPLWLSQAEGARSGPAKWSFMRETTRLCGSGSRGGRADRGLEGYYFGLCRCAR